MDGYRHGLHRGMGDLHPPQCRYHSGSFLPRGGPYPGRDFHGLPKAILVDCGKDYRSALLEDLPDEVPVNADGPLYLNKRFGGLGLLPALGVEVHHALPYHPQSKSIERMFGTLEREWICKLKGWCRSSVKERPNGFAKHLRQLLEKKELLTMDAMGMIFNARKIPRIPHSRPLRSPGLKYTRTE